MTQAYNLSQLANNLNGSGQVSLATGIANAVPIANGGSNNASLLTTAGGIVYTDGSKLVNTGAGTSGQFLKSNGASAPSWISASSTITNISSGSITSGVSSFTLSGLTLTNYKFLYFSFLGVNSNQNQIAFQFGSAGSTGLLINSSVHQGIFKCNLTYGMVGFGIHKNSGSTSIIGLIGDSGYRTSSTSVTFSLTTTTSAGGTFSAGGTYRLYGQT